MRSMMARIITSARRCRECFVADPQKYLPPSPADPAQAGATYTCPTLAVASTTAAGTALSCNQPPGRRGLPEGHSLSVHVCGGQ